MTATSNPPTPNNVQVKSAEAAASRAAAAQVKAQAAQQAVAAGLEKPFTAGKFELPGGKAGAKQGIAGKKKRIDEDEANPRNAPEDAEVAAAGDATESAAYGDGHMLLAQADTATAGAGGGAAASTAAAEAGTGAAAGTAGAAAAGISTAGMIAIGAVAVGVAAASGGGGGAAVASATGFVLSGSVVAGAVTNGAGLTVEAYKADGTLLAGGTAAVNNNGSFTLTITENYSGPVLIRVVDASAGADYTDEGTGAAKDLAVDLRAVTSVSGNGTITVNVTPLTELAVRELTGDAGGDAGTSGTTLGASVTTTQVTAANTAVKEAFGLTTDIVTTAPVTVDASATPNAYGQVLAAIAGAEANLGADTGTVLNTLAQGVSGSTMNQSVSDLLLAGAATADAVPTNLADITTALTALIGSNIGGITISADTGKAGDFVTQTAAQTISATLDTALSSTTLWGSLDNGATWTDISASVTGTALSWTGVTLAGGTNTVKFAVTASTVTAFKGAAADLVAGTKIVVQTIVLDTANPAFTSLAAADFNENGTAAAYKAVATDGSFVTYSWGGGADDALFNLDANSGAVTFKAVPNFEAPTDAGGDKVYNVSVTATDGAGNTATQAVAITVKDVNETPTITSATAASFAENGTGVVYCVSATDPDAGATLTYALAGTDAALFDIVASTGIVTFKAAPNYEAPADAGANNVYDITVTASDGTNTTAAQAVAITVTNVNEMPTFTSGTTASFAESATGTVYTAAATDQDAGTTLTYALGGADAASFSINASTGAVTFVSPPNFEAKSSYGITVTASDGTNTTAAQAVTVSVTNINEAPAVVSGAPTTDTIVVNQALSAAGIASLFSDVDAGDTLTYSATGLPSTLTLNPSTGAITGTPTATGTANVTFTATDAGGLSASHAIAVSIVSAPAITAIAANVVQAKSGDTLIFTATLSEAVTITGSPTMSLTLDVGGQPMTASYTGNPAPNTLTFTATAPGTVDDTSVTVTGISLSGATIVGNLSGQDFMTSATGQAVSSFVIDNVAPVFTSGAAASFAEKATGTVYTAATTDVTAVTYALSGTDATSFTLTNGVLTFNSPPNFEAKASYAVTITATDALAHATSQNVAITVTNVNEAPTVASGAPTTDTIPVGVALSGAGIASLFVDPDAGDTLTYSQTGLPSELTLNSSTGAITGTPASAGTVNVTFTATDSGSLSVSHQIAVSAVSAPTITNTATLDGLANLDVRSDLVLTFSDTIALGSGQIKIMDDMGTSGWTLTNTTTAESKQDVTDNDVVITIANGAVTGLTIGGVDKSAEMSGSVTVNGNKLVISPAGSDNASSTDWDFDWDFGANYHVEMGAGVVTANGIDNVAISDATTLNFTTVTPVGNATGAASQTMASDGSLTAGYTWHHGHIQDATADGYAMSFSTGSHALVLQSETGADNRKTTIGGKVLLSGLGTDDVIYMDNMGDMSVPTTDGQKGANYTGSGNSNARLLDNADGGTQLQTVFADYASTSYTAITSLGGGDLMLENSTHFNANLVIFG